MINPKNERFWGWKVGKWFWVIFRIRMWHRVGLNPPFLAGKWVGFPELGRKFLISFCAFPPIFDLFSHFWPFSQCWHFSALFSHFLSFSSISSLYFPCPFPHFPPHSPFFLTFSLFPYFSFLLIFPFSLFWPFSSFSYSLFSLLSLSSSFFPLFPFPTVFLLGGWNMTG